MTTYLSASEAKVRNFLKKNPASDIASIVAKAKISRPTVRQALIKLEAQGNLIKTADWPRRYTWAEAVKPEVSESGSIIEPEHVEPGDVAKKLSAGAPRIAKAIQGLDLSKVTQQDALDTLATIAKAVLGLYVALGKIEDGPEWRKEAGA